MLEIAQSLKRFAVKADAFDQNPMLLNVLNGTFELKTGELRPHDQRDRITKICPVEYREDALCPTWLAFLDRIFNGNADLIGFVQRAIGYSLTGSTQEQCFLLLWGEGSNGKSTMLELLRDVLGDYADNASTDALMVSSGRGTENDIAKLKGARLVTASESGEGRRLDEERVKRLTGGDTISARFLYREWFEYRPQFKLWLAVNNRPEVRGTDHAIWRRVRLIPFEVVIPDDDQDKELPAKLRAEAPGILRWAVEGCLAWQKEKLNPPKAITSATTEYRSEQNLPDNDHLPSPAKPIKLMDRMPATTKAAAVPLTSCGTLARSSFSRTPAISTSASANPAPAPSA